MLRTLTALLGFVALTQFVIPVQSAFATSDAWDGASSDSEVNQELASIVAERLAFYADSFPNILFVALRGGDAWLISFGELIELLGDGARNLDYEHPDHVREDLTYVSKARVQLMLRAGESSSSMFQVGEDSSAGKKYVCVVTVNPTGTAGDDDVATWHLLEELREKAPVLAIPQGRRLDHRHHLRYVLDHEIFHCLDALYNRPIPMTKDARKADYFFFLNENGADAYAIATHLKRQGQISEFGNLLGHIRGLSLFWGDPQHFTHEAIRRFLERDNGDLAQMSVLEIVALAASVRDGVAPTFDDYVDYKLAAKEAANALEGSPESLCQEMLRNGIRDQELSLRNRLLRTSCQCYAAVFGSEVSAPKD